jgi:NDP-sugar pyrophosphorylase family protein
MKAVILAGGEGTRLRPLTLSTPKPVVPVVDRPFLCHQLDLLAGAGVREIVFSLAYRPERVEAVFGDGSAFGVRILYAVEETPLGTGGAVRNALPLLDDRTIVLNGDILTDVDLARVVARHEREGASATILLTPVPNPAAYGLVETDREGRVHRFLEKPRPAQITTDTINAGSIARDRVRPDAGGCQPLDRAWLPPPLARGDLVLGPVHRGYWIDIGTPEKYLQVHRDILNHRFSVPLDGEGRKGGVVHRSARVSTEALLDGRFYVGPRCEVEAGARVGPDAVLVADVTVRAGARLRDSVLWRGAEAGPGCTVEGSVVGPGVRLGRSSIVHHAVLGEGSVVSDFSRPL